MWSRIEALFWSLQSYNWDDYLQLAECREEIQATARWLAEQLDDEHRRVLDLGCGTGNHALALAELGCDVVGIDFAGGMLKKARAKARYLRQLTFRPADFDQPLPFPANSFDGALGVAVLQCADDPDRFLGEIRRVLKPAALFLLVAVDSSRKREIKKGLRTTPLKAVLCGIKALGNRSRSVHKYSRDELLTMLSAAGFEVLDRGSSTGTIKLLTRALAPQPLSQD